MFGKKRSYYSKGDFSNLPDEKKKDELRKLIFDFSQNLKMPIPYYMLRRKPILIVLGVFGILYFNTGFEEGFFMFFTEGAKWAVPLLYFDYKYLSHLRYDDMLDEFG